MGVWQEKNEIFFNFFAGEGKDVQDAARIRLWVGAGPGALSALPRPGLSIRARGKNAHEALAAGSVYRSAGVQARRWPGVPGWCGCLHHKYQYTAGECRRCRSPLLLRAALRAVGRYRHLRVPRVAATDRACGAA